MKTCVDCNIEKELFSFNTRRSRGKIVRLAYCSECSVIRSKKYYENNREKIKSKRNSNPNFRAVSLVTELKRKYNITIEDYQKIFDSQKGCCASCSRTPEENGKRLAVDHDHKCCPGTKSCGKCIRGLLCDRCNLVLGRVGDDPSVLSALISYLMN